MYPYAHALKKFNRAIYVLSTEKEDIRKRLLLVFTGDLATISKTDLPEKLQKEFECIYKNITKYDERNKGENSFYKTEDGRYDYLLPGRIEATCSRIKKTTGSEIAQKIYHIWSVLDEDSRQEE